MTSTSRPIPVLLMIDAEPTGFFVPRDRPDPWSGLERGFEIMAGVRRTLSQRTGQPAHFNWLVRADPQIEEVYGSAAWGFAHYRRRFEELERIGDEVGLHVHAYRWNDRCSNWIEDYGDQAWVEHCLRLGFSAFEAVVRRRPGLFSMGMDWTSPATMRLARELGVRWEVSTVPGTRAEPLHFYTGPYSGHSPDCSRMPRQPYPPDREDFTRPALSSHDAMWIIPLSSYVARLDLSWKRRLYNRLRLQPVVRRWRKFFLTDHPAVLRPAIDAALREPVRHLTFSVRTDEFLERRSVAAIHRNLDHLLSRAGTEVVFATPEETLKILGTGAA